MKFIRRKKSQRGDESFIFQLSKRDRNLLLFVLKLFPVTKAVNHRLSRAPRPEDEAHQELLVEAMEEQRKGHVKKIEQLIKNEARFFRETEEALQIALSGDQIEWLLQTLNDVRVGSWTLLGCPELEDVRRKALTEEHATHYAAMELSGVFQAVLLEAFEAEEG
jgi:hypothetical protein